MKPLKQLNKIKRRSKSIIKSIIRKIEKKPSPLIEIVDEDFIRITKPIKRNGFDFGEWLANLVNMVDSNDEPITGVKWINPYVVSFSNGLYSSIDDLNEKSALMFIDYMVNTIEESNNNL